MSDSRVECKACGRWATGGDVFSGVLLGGVIGGLFSALMVILFAEETRHAERLRSEAVGRGYAEWVHADNERHAEFQWRDAR